jgi:putative heme iron utilization protein
LFDLGSTGTLATQSRRHSGFPFASLMPYALDSSARPLFLVSTMAMHTQNLAADPHATLMVAAPEAASDPLGSARASVVGTVLPVPAPELAAARELYLERHENSRYWVDFKDFAFYRLEPAEVYYIGGFGVMGWISAEDYTHAEPDPLRASAAGILAHMNADHADALLLLADVFAGIKAEAATMTAVDRLGFHMRLTTADGVRGTRVGFLREARDAGAVRKVLVEMVTLARQAPPAQH